MNAQLSTDAPLRILILALGGEGGGVLMNWVVRLARQAGLSVQATSVPGVAQRTGSTSYYVEITRDPDAVLSLVPMPGRVDVVLASELIEAARAMAAGFVSPELTTLISSSSRVYSTAEKIALGDGRFAAENIELAAAELAKRCHLLDLETMANENATFISATMFGALAGSGVLPWPTQVNREVFGQGELASASLAGFNAAFHAVSGDVPAGDIAPVSETQSDLAKLALPQGSDFTNCTSGLRNVVAHGYARVCDFQDAEYGTLFLTRTNALLRASDSDDHISQNALNEACRRLALWMAYEDIARVADLKTRPARFDRIRAEAQIRPGQVFHVVDYMKPRAEEIAAILPVRIGQRVMRRVENGGSFPFLGRGMHLRTSGVFGFWMLRTVAALKRYRRRSLRYHQEQEAICVWLEAMETAFDRSAPFAAALAELPRVLKGYSDTLLRGQTAYGRIMDSIVLPAISADLTLQTTDRLRRAISAALADESHSKLDEFTLPPDPPKTADQRPDHVH